MHCPIFAKYCYLKKFDRDIFLISLFSVVLFCHIKQGQHVLMFWQSTTYLHNFSSKVKDYNIMLLTSINAL